MQNLDPLVLWGQVKELLPGGQLALPGAMALSIQSVIECEERVGANRSYSWRWLFMEDGSLLECSPAAAYRCHRHMQLAPQTEQYQELVAPDGALMRFEHRVRTGALGLMPVIFSLGDREYRLLSTGKAEVKVSGEMPPLTAWQKLRKDPRDNVYFVLSDLEQPEERVFGLWTDEVSLSWGRQITAPPTAAARIAPVV
jgi:hypothetical protein